jgi:hypothetical protein
MIFLVEALLVTSKNKGKNENPCRNICNVEENLKKNLVRSDSYVEEILVKEEST